MENENNAWSRLFESEMEELLDRPSQETLRALHTSAVALATNKEGYEYMQGSHTVDSGDGATTTVDVHVGWSIQPTPNNYDGAMWRMIIFEVKELSSLSRWPEESTYSLWWKSDKILPEQSYYELRQGKDGCNETDAEYLVGLLPRVDHEGSIAA